MDTLLQQLINGLTLGAVYALVALGYTMVYGIIGLINFAHGEVVMIGTMVAFTVIVSLAPSGMPPLLILGSGLLGRYFYSKIHDGLSGHETNYAELKANAERLKTVTPSVKFMPELLTPLATEERQLLEDSIRCPVIVRPLYIAWRSLRARLRLNRHVKLAMAAAATQSSLIEAHRARLQETAFS